MSKAGKNPAWEQANIYMYDGKKLVATHSKDMCVGRNCCIHSPSPHPLAVAAFQWHADTKRMFRVCAHGIEHPDPDDVEYNLLGLGGREQYDVRNELMRHKCDGCCKDED